MISSLLEAKELQQLPRRRKIEKKKISKEFALFFGSSGAATTAWGKKPNVAAHTLKTLSRLKAEGTCDLCITFVRPASAKLTQASATSASNTLDFGCTLLCWVCVGVCGHVWCNSAVLCLVFVCGGILLFNVTLDCHAAKKPVKEPENYR